MPSTDEVIAADRGLDPAVVRDFLSRMDPDYLSAFAPEDVARHVRLSTRLDDEHPVQVEIASRGERRYDVVVVGFDYFSELSILCGLLASFSLDIEAGSIYTFGPDKELGLPQAMGGRARRPPKSARKRIVDVFRVRLLPEADRFEADDVARFRDELMGLVRRLGAGRIDEARDRLNQRLAEHFERVKPRAPGILYPVDVRFDNEADPRWTVVDVDARDTPAFLYAVTGALAARGVYVQKVRIESRGQDVRDRFYLSRRRGGKIESAADQEALRVAIVLAKQFTHVLPRAPDPAKATRHFDQLLDKLMESGSGAPPPLLREEEGLAALARLLGSSDFLWEDFLRMQFESLMPVLGDLQGHGLRDAATLEGEIVRAMEATSTHAEAWRAANQYKDREMFFIDMKHLLDPAVGVEAFSRALTDLAEAVVRAALRQCDREMTRQHGPLHAEDPPPPRFAICGLGKFGGGEMGYASDIELLFVHDGGGHCRGPRRLPSDEYYHRLAEELLRFIEARAEGIFRIDLRLRPYGRDGPLVSSMDDLVAYYRGGGPAQPFERQALVKLRAVAGDPELGRAVEEHRDTFTYGGAPWDQGVAVHLRERQARELVKTGEVNLKYSPGGLLDVEYAVQYLQVLHGATRPELRTPTTLAALERLRDALLVPPSEHDALREGYLFLRRAIEALRMVKGEAHDVILPATGSDEMKFLARRLGYKGIDWSDAAQRFENELAAHMAAVRDFYDRRWGRGRGPIA